MPRGPRGERRPADVVGAAIMVAKIATGEIPEDIDRADDTKNPHAVALGRLGGKKGGKARAAKMTSKERRESARRAAVARWRNR